MEPKQYLSEIEQDKIKRFNEDKVLKEALRKVFLSPLYQQGVMTPAGLVEGNSPARNFALTPAFHMLLQKREMWDIEKLGMVTLSNAMAIQLIEQGFGELEKFVNVSKTEEKGTDVDPQ